MPHCLLSNMADHHRESAKMYYAKGRKTVAARKRSSRQPPGSGAAAVQSCSPCRSTTPPGSGSDMNRQDICPQTPNSSWSANGEMDLHFVGSYRCPAEHQEGVLGQSPPKNGALRPTAGTQVAPAPASLPRPPSSWTAAGEEEITATVVYSDIPDNDGSILANQLKMLLKVQG